MQQVQLLEIYTLSFCLAFLDNREIYGAFWAFKCDGKCIVLKVAFSPSSAETNITNLFG